MNYFPFLLLFSFSLLSQFKNGCKCFIFVSGAIYNHTRHPDTTPRPDTPTRGTPRPDTDKRNGSGCNPERPNHHRKKYNRHPDTTPDRSTPTSNQDTATTTQTKGSRAADKQPDATDGGTRAAAQPPTGHPPI